eukprot:NODE_37_length_31305_cov_0.348939.p13 type:complete len:118 gc:universal NODE_37_length_31305_cov_0.348939:22754-23107(+)
MYALSAFAIIPGNSFTSLTISYLKAIKSRYFFNSILPCTCVAVVSSSINSFLSMINNKVFTPCSCCSTNNLLIFECSLYIPSLIIMCSLFSIFPNSTLESILQTSVCSPLNSIFSIK